MDKLFIAPTPMDGPNLCSEFVVSIIHRGLEPTTFSVTQERKGI